MTGQEGTMVGPAPTTGGDLIELLLLLPAQQLTALEKVADQSKQTVVTLVRQVINDFLESPSAMRFVGEKCGKPMTPDAHFQDAP